MTSMSLGHSPCMQVHSAITKSLCGHYQKVCHGMICSSSYLPSIFGLVAVLGVQLDIWSHRTLPFHFLLLVCEFDSLSMPCQLCKSNSCHSIETLMLLHVCICSPCVLQVVFAFITAIGIGANDISNSFATSVASRALSLAQVVVVGGICEVLPPSPLHMCMHTHTCMGTRRYVWLHARKCMFRMPISFLYKMTSQKTQEGLWSAVFGRGPPGCRGYIHNKVRRC